MSQPARDDDDTFSGEVMIVLEALKAVEVNQTTLEIQHKLEKLQLEKKYADLQKPLYERRSALAAGSAQPTAAEVNLGREVFKQEDPEYEPSPSLESLWTRLHGVPEFWLTAMQNHEDLSGLIEDHDEEALMYLADIRLEYTGVSTGSSRPTYSQAAVKSYSSPSRGESQSKVKPGFKLFFHFRPNPFFHNAMLEKEYFYKPNPTPYSGGGFVFDYATGASIAWKSASMNLTEIKDDDDDQSRNPNKGPRCKASFFKFFRPPAPLPELSSTEKVDMEELEDLVEELEEDLEAGENIKDDIIPRALEYFIDPPDWDDEDEDDGDDDENDDDDDEDDDDDDDSDSD